MTSASRSTAVAMPSPICWSIRSGERMNAPKTTIMIAAAAVITPPVWARPSRTATTASPVRFHSSCIREIRNTS